MNIEDLKETAAIAHLNPDKEELDRLFPDFTEMIGFFDSMEAAEKDTDAFPEGLASVSAALAGASGNYRTVNSGFYRSGVNKSANTNSNGLTDRLLENASERDGRFFVVPNIL